MYNSCKGIREPKKKKKKHTQHSVSSFLSVIYLHITCGGIDTLITINVP